MDGFDTSAFERAAALLQRDEHLDDNDYGTEILSTERSGRGPVGGGQRQPAQRSPPKRRATGHTNPPRPHDLSAPPSKPLPSLAELSTQPVLDLQKAAPAGPPRAGRRSAALTGADSRSAAMSAMDAAMPSLDEESARLVARARALLDDNGTDPAAVDGGRTSTMRRRPAAVRAGGSGSGAARLPGRVSTNPSRAATRSAPTTSDGGGGADRGAGMRGAVVEVGDEDSEEAEVLAMERGAGDAAARAAELLAWQSADAVASAVAAAAAADANRGSPGSSLEASPNGRRTQPPASFVPPPTFGVVGEEEETAAQTQAQLRVRQARLAEERRKKEEREAAERRAAVAAAEAERLKGFQADVKRRAAAKQREKKEASERQAAEAAEAAQERDARVKRQAESQEEVRQRLAHDIAQKRANAKARVEQEEQARRAEQVEAKARSEAEGAQLQAAALARVRGRRKQVEAERERGEIQAELDYLASQPEHEDVRMGQAREQRSAAAERLRERRQREDGGVGVAAGSGGAGGGAGAGRRRGGCGRAEAVAQQPAASSRRQGAGYRVQADAEAGGSDEEWGGEEEPWMAGDDLPEAPWMAPFENFTNVGFVIRGEPPETKPVGGGRRGGGGAAVHSGAARGGAAVGRGEGRGAAALPTGCDMAHPGGGARGGGGGGGGGARGSLGGHAGRDSRVPAREVTVQQQAGWSGGQAAEIAEPPQVLEIRSPEKVRSPRQEVIRARPRADPPPVAPVELEAEYNNVATDRAAPAGSSAPLKPATGGGAAPRRLKPWQRAPVPLDRPL